jgi:hypothetical protein
MRAMRSLRVLLIDALLGGAVLVGVLWAVVWLDVAPGPQEEISPVPAGLPAVAAASALLVLVPALLGSWAWWGGRRAARPMALVTGATLVGTAPGWERVANASVGEVLSLVVDGLLVVMALPRLWVPPVRAVVGKPGRLRMVGLALLVPLLVPAVSTAWFGWSLRVVNRPEEGETGWPYLLAGLAVCLACVVVGARLLRGGRAGGGGGAPL